MGIHRISLKLVSSNQLDPSLTTMFIRTIVVAMAVSCSVDIESIMNQLNSVKTKVLWQFNVYDADQCQDDLRFKPENSSIFKVSMEKGQKTAFWLRQLQPIMLLKRFELKHLDFIWLVDQDMALGLFNLDGFLKIVERLDVQIAAPALLARTSTESTSYHQELWHSNIKNDMTIMARQTSMIEIDVPLFRFEIWKFVFAHIDEGFEDLDPETTTWGPDRWWCGIAQMYKPHEQSIPCAVIHYTPLYHLDTNTIDKTKSWRQRQVRAVEKQKILFHKLFDEVSEMKKKLQENKSFAEIHYAEYEASL